jgi:hypothetical protein
MPGVKIGRGSLVAAGTIVNKSAPNFSLIVGNPGVVKGSTLNLDKKYFTDELVEKNYFSKEIDEKKIFFQIRNHTHFSRNFITNKIIYCSNMYIYLFYFILRNFFSTSDKKFFFKRLYLILKAVRSGNSKQLISY